MATRKAAQAETENDELQNAIALLQDDSFSGDAISPALESLYAELGMGEAGEATVHVTILNVDGTGKEANIWRGNPENYDLESLARQFGSGEYRVKIYVRVPQGSKVLKANKIFYWKLTPEEEKRRLNPQVDAPVMTPADIARMVLDGIRAAMPAPVSTPQPDPFDQMQKMAAIMQMMRPAAHEVAAPQPVNQLGMIRDVAELLQTLKGDDEPSARGANGNDLLMTVISKFAPLLTGVLAQQPGAAIPGAMPAPQLTQTPYPDLSQSAPATPTQAIPQPTSEEENMSIKLRLGLSWMIGQCDGGGAPETYAEVVLDSVPPEAVNALITSPAPLDYLAQFEPRVKTEPYATWFTNLIKACKEMLTEDGGNHETPA